MEYRANYQRRKNPATKKGNFQNPVKLTYKEELTPMTISSISSIKNLDTSSFIIDNSMSFSFLQSNANFHKDKKNDMENSRRNINLRKSKISKGSKNKKYKLKDGIQDIKIQYERTLSKKRNDSKETVKKVTRLPLKKPKKMFKDLVSSTRTSPEKERMMTLQNQNTHHKADTKREKFITNTGHISKRVHFRRFSPMKSRKKRHFKSPSDEICHFVERKNDLLHKIQLLPKEGKFFKARRSPMKAKATKGFYMRRKKRKSHNMMNPKMRRDSFGISKKQLGGSSTGLTQTFNDFLNKAKMDLKQERNRDSSK